MCAAEAVWAVCAAEAVVLSDVPSVSCSDENAAVATHWSEGASAQYRSWFFILFRAEAREAVKFRRIPPSLSFPSFYIVKTIPQDSSNMKVLIIGSKC